MLTLYITHPTSWLHDMGPGHPECPQRLDAIEEQLQASGVMQHLLRAQVQSPATDDHLLRVHTQAYLDHLRQISPREGLVSLDADTLLNPDSLVAARYAAGGAVQAVDEILGARALSAFCAIRPPGHHALRAQGMGFCVFNNVAVAAAHALEHHGLERVAIVDFDVHHGNGTEDIFADDPRVLMCGFFQHPFYPHSGANSPAGNMVNIPVGAYAKGDVIRSLVERSWLPRLKEFEPQLLLVSAGFDAHTEDDLAQLGLVEADYAWLTEVLMGVAEQHSEGRLVSVLEGGYNLGALGRSVVAHVKALAKL